MSAWDEKRCSICRSKELTSATKVYPICECTLYLCFDCLRRYAQNKYCCPFCNIPFSQNTFRQTAEELKLRLRGKVASDLLEEVVEAWVNQLKEMSSDMEVGLAVLSLDFDEYAFTQRAGSPLESMQPYWSSSSYLFNVMPAIQLSTSPQNDNSFVLPLLTPKLSSNSGLSSDVLCVKRVRSAPGVWSSKTSLLSPTFQKTPDSSPNKNLKMYPHNFVPPTLGDDSKSPDRRQQKPLWFFPSPGESAESFNKFVKNSVRPLIPILTKQLYVRELVKILPGTKLASKLAPGSFGVVMKYTGKLQSRAEGDFRLDKYHPISLTVRLLNGSWLTKVAVDDVEATGERATLRQYLRIGDLLQTRFGIASTCEIHQRSGQVTIRYPKGFKSLEKHCNTDNLGDILQSVREACDISESACPDDLYDKKTESRLPKSEICNICTFETKDATEASSNFERNSVLRSEMKSCTSIMTKKDEASILESGLLKGRNEHKILGKPHWNRPTERSRPLERKLCEFDTFEKKVISLDDIVSSNLMSDQHVDRSFGITEFDTKKIWEGDIQAVFSAREIFNVIEQKIVDNRHKCQNETTKDNWWSSPFKARAPSKGNSKSTRPHAILTLDQGVSPKQNICYFTKPMGSQFKKTVPESPFKKTVPQSRYGFV